MKNILFGIATLLGVTASVPASAQILVTPTPGVGVQVGPLAVGIWPDTWGHPYGGYAQDPAYAFGPGYAFEPGYAIEPECRVVRARTVTPHGTVVWRTRRVCD